MNKGTCGKYHIYVYIYMYVHIYNKTAQSK